MWAGFCWRGGACIQGTARHPSPSTKSIEWTRVAALHPPPAFRDETHAPPKPTAQSQSQRPKQAINQSSSIDDRASMTAATRLADGGCFPHTRTF